MDSDTSKRCIHFQIISESLEVMGPPVYLAIRRCLLTERMIRLLEQAPEGISLAEKLMVSVSESKKFAFVGPDFEAVTQSACTVHRCTQHCTPAYLGHLNYFHQTDEAADEIACSDDDKEAEVNEIEKTPGLCS